MTLDVDSAIGFPLVRQGDNAMHGTQPVLPQQTDSIATLQSQIHETSEDSVGYTARLHRRSRGAG
jgi:hypothetical protein